MIFKKPAVSIFYFSSSIPLGLVIIFLGIYRGFDLSDEGLYILLLDPEQANEGGVYNYDLFFKLFYKIIGIEFGIIGSRWIRLISYFAGAYALTKFWQTLHQENHSDKLVFMISVLGLFGGYAFLPPSLSYNSLSVILACFWLWLISKDSPGLLDKLSLGLLIALFFYVKFTVVFSIGFLTLVHLLLRKNLEWKTLIPLGLPILVLEGIFYWIFSESGFTRILEGFEIMSNRTDYHWVLLIKNNLVGIYWAILVFVPFFLISKLRVKFKYLFLFVSIVFSFWIFKKTMITNEWSHLLLIVSLIALSWQSGKLNWREVQNSKKSIFFILMILPFALHLGSNVYFLRLGIHYWVFWILAFMVLNAKQEQVNNWLIHSVPIGSLILLLSGIWIMPFGDIPLWEYNTTWKYRSGKEIMLTPEMVKMLEDLKSNTSSIPDDRLIAVYRNPGWLVLLGRTSPQSPGIWDKEQLEAAFPDFPKGFEAILYFPYQELPTDISENFEEKQYKIGQGILNLELRKEEP